jgi:hypothetical protein
MIEQNYHGDDEKDVYQLSSDVTDKAQQPENQQNDEDRD